MGDFLVYSKDSKEVSEAEWAKMTVAGNEVREKFQITYVIERALMFTLGWDGKLVGELSTNKWHGLTSFLTGSLCLTSWEQTEVEKSQMHTEQSGAIPKNPGGVWWWLGQKGSPGDVSQSESWYILQSLTVGFAKYQMWDIRERQAMKESKERKCLESEQL